MLAIFAAPSVTPVSLAEVKADLRVIHSYDDALLGMLLDAAVTSLDGAEGTLGRCMVTQTWDWTIDGFTEELKIPLPTLQSITSITYRDANGDTQTATGHMVSGQRVTMPDGWPGTDGNQGAVTVRFVAGYGVADDVPAALKAAILLKVRDLYDKGEENSDAIIRLCRPYKSWRV